MVRWRGVVGWAARATTAVEASTAEPPKVADTQHRRTDMRVLKNRNDKIKNKNKNQEKAKVKHKEQHVGALVVIHQPNECE